MERKCGLLQFLHKINSKGNKRDQKFGIMVLILLKNVSKQ